MKQEQILQLNICPFNQDVISDIMYGEETEGEKKAHVILMLRYLALLVKQCQMALPIPQLTVCQKRNKDDTFFHYSSFTEERRDLMEDVLKTVLINSGWSYGKGRMKEKGANLRLYSLKSVGAKDYRKARLQIPHIFKLKQSSFERLYVTVCWNERIARFHNYAVSNPKEIEVCFHEGAAMIERILRKMADPFAIGKVFYNYGEEQYVMGFFEGNSDEGELSIENMDYNFFVQAIVLHMLLTCAEERFGLPEWEVEHET